MIGKMIEKARTDKGFTKLELSKLTGINIGHLTHIEKGERTPSHKALKKICQVLEIPFQPIMYTYDKKLPKEMVFRPMDYISYERIPLIENITDFISCPPTHPNVSFAIQIKDDSMNQSFDTGIITYVEQNTMPALGDIGLFYYNGKVVIRKLALHRFTIVLKADNKDYEDIEVSKNDCFYIIGKIIR